MNVRRPLCNGPRWPGLRQANPEHRRDQDGASDAQHVHDRSGAPDLDVGGFLDRYRPENQHGGNQREVGSQPRGAPAQRSRGATERWAGREGDDGRHQSLGDVRGLELETFPVRLRPGVPRPHTGHGERRGGQGEDPRAPMQLPVDLRGVAPMPGTPALPHSGATFARSRTTYWL